MYQQLGDKFIRNVILQSDFILSKHNPETRLYTLDNVIEMIDKYSQVYLKPNVGNHGTDILRITKKEEKIALENEKMQRKELDLNSLPSWVEPQYIVQQGIDAHKINNKNYVFRYHLQKIDGVIQPVLDSFKIATDSKFCINAFQGNIKIETLDYGINLTGVSKSVLTEVVERVGQVLTKWLPGLGEASLDIVIDTNLHPWVVDINTRIPALGTWKTRRIDDVRRRQKELRSVVPPALNFRRMGTSNPSKDRRSKLAKSEILSKVDSLKDHIPEECTLTSQSLHAMLEKHKFAYVKPDKGSLGRNIVRVFRRGKNIMERTQTGRSTLFRVRPGYVIQQGIDTLKSDKKMVDFRVITAKAGEGWKFQGIVARKGKENDIVTNYSAGGKPCDAFSFIYEYTASFAQTRQYLRELRRISIECSNAIGKEFPQIKKFGIDLAIDTNGRMWVIEVNTTPTTKMFKLVGSRHMRRRVANV
jgi:glutathione synthase/RimK-type ligase-like ATP-grasp enzyme